MNISDFLAIIVVVFASFFIGSVLYYARKSMTYTGRLCATVSWGLLLGIAGSCYIAYEHDFAKGGHMVGQIIIAIAMAILAMFTINDWYWQLLYSNSKHDEDNYEIYANWKKSTAARQRSYADQCGESMDKVFLVPLIIFIFTVLFMLWVYMPKEKISDDFAVETESIYDVSVKFTVDTSLYDGLPLSDDYLLGHVEKGTTLNGAVINLVEYRRDYTQKYWVLYENKQSDEVKEKLAYFFKNKDYVIFDNIGADVYRKDGQLIR